MKPMGIYNSLFVIIMLIFNAGCSGSDSGSSDRFSLSGKDEDSPVAGKNISIKHSDQKTVIVVWDEASDNMTSKKDLQYKLVFSDKNNISDVEGAQKYGRTAMGWTPGVLSRQVKGISPSSTYYFTALVRDEAGNVSVYKPQILSTPDNNPPVARGTIAFSNITKDGLVVSWPPAVDDVTSQENLQYKLVYMPQGGMRMTIEADNNSSLLMDWAVNARTHRVSGLPQVNAYYFVVMVRDESGNKANYPPQKVTGSSDTAAPSPDEGVFVSDVTDRSATVSWNAATDDVTTQEKLQYKVVYSKNRDIFSVSDAESNGQTALGWTANISSHKVRGLEPSTTYYFVTIVKDEAGNSSLYDIQNASTQNDSGKEDEEDEMKYNKTKGDDEY